MGQKKALRLIGVSLSELVYEDDVQLSFFDSDKRDKARTLDKTVDSIRNKFGKNMIVRGGVYKNNIREKNK